MLIIKPTNDQIDFVTTINILLGDDGVMNVKLIIQTHIIHKIFKFTAFQINIQMFILTNYILDWRQVF